ncbi:MAG: DUF4349 domain-containing protein [Clostridiales bacterium]|nr:DUF4349 domain-containing protein [Clostridiales bacterium]
MKYVKEIKLRNKILMALLAASLVGGSVTGCGSTKSDKADVTNYGENQYAVSYEDEAAGQESAEVADYELEQDNASADGDYGFEKSVENYDEAKVSDDTKASTNTSEKRNADSKEQNSVSDGIKKDNKKIIKRYNYTYETEEFDKAYAYLKQQIEAFDGYVSSSEITGSQKRSLYLTARIPADNSDSFVGQLGSLGTMMSQSESAEDITLQYADTESRIASLKTEQERLLALLKKADSLESIITLEDRLTEVRYELENYESQRKVYDDLVTYSTITITLEEVTYTVPVDDSTFFTRVKTGLEKSLRDVRMGLIDFLVGLIVALPYLVVWGISIFLIVWIIKKLVKRYKRKKQAKQNEKMESLQEEAKIQKDVAQNEMSEKKAEPESEEKDRKE